MKGLLGTTKHLENTRSAALACERPPEADFGGDSEIASRRVPEAGGGDGSGHGAS